MTNAPRYEAVDDLFARMLSNAEREGFNVGRHGLVAKRNPYRRPEMVEAWERGWQRGNTIRNSPHGGAV